MRNPPTSALSRLRDSNAALTVLVIAAEIFSMGGFASFAMALPELMALWKLTPADGGWISGAYYGGYVLAVPFLVGLTDRIETRRIYVVSCVVGVLGGAGFIFFARGLWTATLFRALVGAALAGTYMPGLRILTERLGERGRLRAIPYYTASFGVGVSLSFPVCGRLGETWGWPAAFWAGAVGPAIAAGLVILATRPLGGSAAAPVPESPTRHPLDFRPVFSNRAVLAYVFAYGGHCWELFALRAWMAAFLGFAWSHGIGQGIGQGIGHSVGREGGGVAWWVSLCVMAGVPASILGAELALRVGRRKLIQRAAWLSVVTGIGAGFSTELSFGLVVALTFFYNIVVAADSGALTTGAVAHARPGEQGATLAVHSLVGFSGGAISPFVVGLALDRSGGLDSASAWAWAMIFTALGSAVAALAMTFGDAKSAN